MVRNIKMKFSCAQRLKFQLPELNLVLRVLELLGKQAVAGRDSVVLEFLP